MGASGWSGAVGANFWEGFARLDSFWDDINIFDGGSVGMGLLLGFLGWFFVRHGLGGFFTVDQNQRAVKTVFGRAQRLATTTLHTPRRSKTSLAPCDNASERSLRAMLPWPCPSKDVPVESIVKFSS